MEKAENLARLQWEQERVLKSNEECRKIRQKLKDDYVTLQKRLVTLPENLTEKCIVPVGKVAFFPGHLVHTNEILVLLGDNWFVERSAKQACEIVDRRIKLVESQLEELKKEETHISAQKSYTEEFHKEGAGDVREIQEKVPDDDETLPSRKGRSRKAHAAKHDVVPRSVSFQDTETTELVNDLARSNSDTIDHDELFARLNQLEREEQEEEDRLHEEHMSEILNGNFTPSQNLSATQDDETSGRHVKFKSDVTARGNLTSDSDDDDDDETRSSCIKFTHTPHQPQRERSASESDLRTSIKTPADLYDHFASKNSKSFEEVYPGEKQPILKSILKKDSQSNSNENLKLRPILKASPEHQPGTPEQVSFDHDTRPLHDPQSILKTPPDTQGSDRRPGTPEYALNDEPRPILKTVGSDGEGGGGDLRRPILKGMEQYDDDDASGESDGEETNSILKTSSDSVRFDDNVRFNDNVRFDDSVRFNNNIGHSSGKSPTEGSGRKPILKNSGNEISLEERFKSLNTGVAENVVERSLDENDNRQPEVTSSRRPVSRFKASRSQKR